MEFKRNRDVASHFPQYDDELDWAFILKIVNVILGSSL